jgi:hypothetical protein
MTIPPPPPPGSDIAEHYAQISHRFVEHAKDQLGSGNRLQASEKVWGAANYALKAIALQRGWRHAGQKNVFAIADQLQKEFARPDLNDRLYIARAIHYNFYDNDLEDWQIQGGITSVENYVADLDMIRAAAPQPFTITTTEDQSRLQRLTGQTFALGTHSENGFVQPPQPQRRRRRRSIVGENDEPPPADTSPTR